MEKGALWEWGGVEEERMGGRPPSGRGSGRGHERGVQLGNPLAAGASLSIGDELGPYRQGESDTTMER